ncbi:MAG TPA: hypothetical protein VEJ18_03265, partial [Planctomycetota bacterium]|nr:hypothetical protein [Planctomycetota bacterium]
MSRFRLSGSLAVLAGLVLAALLGRSPEERIPSPPRSDSQAPAPGTARPRVPEGARVAGGIGVSEAWTQALPPNLQTRLMSLRSSEPLREKDGVVHFNARAYGASVDGRRAEWALPRVFDDPRPRPRWAFQLLSVDVGGASWARS